MTTLAIDPATTSGIAIVRGAELLYVDTIKLRPSDFIAKQAVIQRLYAEYEWDRAVLEDQWIGEVSTAAGRAKAQGALIVRESATMWRAAIQAVTTANPEMIQPGTWRARVFPGRVPRQRAQAKEAALRFCRGRGWVVGSVDAAEAVCIACSVEWAQKATTPKK